MGAQYSAAYRAGPARFYLKMREPDQVQPVRDRNPLAQRGFCYCGGMER